MPSSPDRRRLWLVGLALLALVAGSFAVRVGKAFSDPNFEAARAEGMLRSDPALLYHFTRELIDAGGFPPADWGADRSVEWPREVDVPATFSIGLEFVVGWSYALFGGDRPLHSFAIVLMSLVASLTVLGAYGLAREASGSERWGLFAALLWCLLPVSYRTVGIGFMREDLAFPLFALHLWFALRAARRPSRSNALVAGLALAAALASWHATTYFLLIEGVTAVLWLVVTGRSPVARSCTRWMAAPVVAACFLVPVLRSTGAILSPGVIACGALVVAVELGRGERRRQGFALLSSFALAGVARVLFSSALSDHAHVSEVIRSKLANLGVKPGDPTELSFDARLLWQGPFETLTLNGAFWFLGVALVGIPLATTAFARRPMETVKDRWTRVDARGCVALYALLALLAAWLFQRVTILPGLLLPAVLACSLHPLGRRGGARLLAGLGLLAQAGLFAVWFQRTRVNAWYAPAGRNDEIERLVEALPGLVPQGEAIAADFMISTAILAHTGHPILLQPKYETAESRRRARMFLEGVFHTSPEELRETLTGEYDCRYVLFDRATLDWGARYTAGLSSAPGNYLPGSAAEAFLVQDDEVLENVPGYELVYRSPPSIRQSNGAPFDLFRLYRME